jgi:hypothetical protein
MQKNFKMKKTLSKIWLYIVVVSLIVTGVLIGITKRIIKRGRWLFWSTTGIIVITIIGSILGRPYSHIVLLLSYIHVISIYAYFLLFLQANTLYYFLGYSLYSLFLIPLFARIYREVGLIKDGVIIHDITTSIYFSLVTWTTLGYGDIRHSEAARFYATTEAFFGYLFMGLLVSFIILMSSKKNKPQKTLKYKKKHPFYKPSISQ